MPRPEEYDNLDAAMDVMKNCFQDVKADFNFPGQLGLLAVLIHFPPSEAEARPYDVSISFNLSREFMSSLLKNMLRDLKNGDLEPPPPEPSLN